MEIWKNIKGYEGKYQISSYGRVKSLKGYHGEDRVYILKPHTSTNLSINYSYVTLWLNCKSKKLSVHRLVAEHFIPNPLNKPFINHIDNNPQNNNMSNLEWCTQKENIQHSLKQGRRTQNTQKAMILLATKRKQEAFNEAKNLLKDCFINLEHKNSDKSNKRKAFITFKCSQCSNITTMRYDAFKKRLCNSNNVITLCGSCLRSHLTTLQWKHQK